MIGCFFNSIQNSSIIDELFTYTESCGMSDALGVFDCAVLLRCVFCTFCALFVICSQCNL